MLVYTCFGDQYVKYEKLQRTTFLWSHKMWPKFGCFQNLKYIYYCEGYKILKRGDLALVLLNILCGFFGLKKHEHVWWCKRITWKYLANDLQDVTKSDFWTVVQTVVNCRFRHLKMKV